MYTSFGCNKMTKIAYLTIDDGPTAETDSYVDFLDSENIKAIWFCLGILLEKLPAQAVYAVRRGHVIGNHSWDHPHFSEIDLEKAREQIARTDRIIETIYTEAGTARPARLFRFPYLDNGSGDPYGECDWSDPHVAALQNILRKMGYSQPLFENITYERTAKSGFLDCANVDCTYDSCDWCLEDGVEWLCYRDLRSILARTDEDVPESGRGLNYPRSNEIVMMHADKGLDVFKAVLNKIMGKGIRFELPGFGNPC